MAHLLPAFDEKNYRPWHGRRKQGLELRRQLALVSSLVMFQPTYWNTFANNKAERLREKKLAQSKKK